MEWLLFTYWLPPEPSRKRVFVWRQLKKIGALSIEGGGWLLPKRMPLSTKIENIAHAVEEMGGTTNLYIVTHFSKAQEQRAIAKFQQERQREYSEIIEECQKSLRHIEREHQLHQFNIEEVEELESDLEKLKRWYSEAKKRDFWEVAARDEVEKLIDEVEASLADFTQKTHDILQSPQREADIQ
jgi:DNA repair exonuclease SbcCD ATPase subunit